MMIEHSATSSAKPPFLAFVKNGDDIAALKLFAQAHNWSDGTVFSGDIGTAIEYLKTHPSPVLLLVEIPSASAASALLDNLANVCDPETKVITIGDVNEYSFYCWLMDIGISSYLLRPLTSPMLENAYQKSTATAQPQTMQEHKPGMVIAVIGARGGVGATTLALNLAGVFAECSAKKVALVDFDPQEGSISLQLDIEPSRGLRDALEKPDRIDGLFIERVMTRPHPNLAVISAEESIQEAVHISEYAADALLKELCDKFDVIVLDIPRHLNPFSKQALKKSDHVLLVAELTLQSLRDTLRLSDLMHDQLKMKLPQLVINRFGMAPKQEMSVADFEKGTNMKMIQRVAFVPDIFMQIGTDIPSISMKKHPDTNPLYELAASLVPDMPVIEENKEKDIWSFLKKKPKKKE